MKLVQLGDIVLYTGEVYNNIDQHPAIVTRVWTPDVINLQVFPDIGLAFVKTSVMRKGMVKYSQSYWEHRPE